ncbi:MULTISPECIES: hypothetical protein [Oscillatoriales]|nr:MULTISPECIES: hypothetical protein [Oscillatoriales]
MLASESFNSSNYSLCRRSTKCDMPMLRDAIATANLTISLYL